MVLLPAPSMPSITMRRPFRCGGFISGVVAAPAAADNAGVFVKQRRRDGRDGRMSLSACFPAVPRLALQKEIAIRRLVATLPAPCQSQSHVARRKKQQRNGSKSPARARSFAEKRVCAIWPLPRVQSANASSARLARSTRPWLPVSRSASRSHNPACVIYYAAKI